MNSGLLGFFTGFMCAAALAIIIYAAYQVYLLIKMEKKKRKFTMKEVLTFYEKFKLQEEINKQFVAINKHRNVLTSLSNNLCKLQKEDPGAIVTINELKDQIKEEEETIVRMTKDMESNEEKVRKK